MEDLLQASTGMPFWVSLLMGLSIFENFCGVSMLTLATLIGPAPIEPIVPRSQCLPQDQDGDQCALADCPVPPVLAEAPHRLPRREPGGLCTSSPEERYRPVSAA